MDRSGLSEDQVAQFRKDGFLRIDDLATAAEIAEVGRIYDRLFADRAGWERGDFFDMIRAERADEAYVTPQMLRLSAYEPALKASPLIERACAAARSILGPEARLTIDHGIQKPPRSEAAVPWHQDEAFWDARYDHDGLSIWIPLEAADETNGCMSFIPGSHRRGVLSHRPLDGDPQVHALEIAGFAGAHAVSCPVPLGGAVAHHVRMIHGSGPNRSDSPRRAYVLVFEGRRRRRLFPRPGHWRLAAKTARAERARQAEAASPGP